MRARPSRRSSPTASTPSGPRRGGSEGGAEVAGTEQVLVPDIGDFEDVPVIEVLVAVGDTVAAEDPLVVLESDKATMEVPSPTAGKVAAIEVAVGDKVKEGSTLLQLEVSGGNGAEPAPGGAVAGTSIAAQESEKAAEVEEPEPIDTSEAPASPQVESPASPQAGAGGAPPPAAPRARPPAREPRAALRTPS